MSLPLGVAHGAMSRTLRTRLCLQQHRIGQVVVFTTSARSQYYLNLNGKRGSQSKWGGLESSSCCLERKRQSTCCSPVMRRSKLLPPPSASAPICSMKNQSKSRRRYVGQSPGSNETRPV